MHLQKLIKILYYTFQFYATNNICYILQITYQKICQKNNKKHFQNYKLYVILYEYTYDCAYFAVIPIKIYRRNCLNAKKDQ